MKLVAVKMGFHNGAMVNKGETVEFPDGHKAPKWAKPAGEAAAVIAADAAKERTGGDTKPVAVQAAVRKKAASLGE